MQAAGWRAAQQLAAGGQAAGARNGRSCRNDRRAGGQQQAYAIRAATIHSIFLLQS